MRLSGIIDETCCVPLLREAMSQDAADRMAAALQVLSDPGRLRLLSLIAAHEGAEACVCDLTEPLGLSQPTVSHHLKVLMDAGLLERERRGKWVYYRLNKQPLDVLARALSAASVFPVTA